MGTRLIRVTTLQGVEMSNHYAVHLKPIQCCISTIIRKLKKKFFLMIIIKEVFEEGKNLASSPCSLLILPAHNAKY